MGESVIAGVPRPRIWLLGGQRHFEQEVTES